jgi:hypothetical protein
MLSKNIASGNMNRIEGVRRHGKTKIIGLYHPPDGVTNPKYKLFCSYTTNFFGKEKKALSFNQDRCCHLALCLWMIWGAQKLTGENLKVVWAECSTLS